ncbi:LPS translocon maturation chaperone LptM [Microbulbifer yueqingensis]|uniref:Lipoprotein-attachment site-containing protein n=1 Tax=Microbulbifer yueqingensis TaxID=658219 RepID=A0A1G9EEW0_9GAMM|nr:lipoprotein [Microbulbifer yueqingensis]SDK74601.1 lipoprotein-attachment site-containing protein [Microbulbifer yueqingensis]
MLHRFPVAILFTLVFTLVALGGCGQKGPLYLPQDPAQPAAPASAAPAPGTPLVPTAPTDTDEVLQPERTAPQAGPVTASPEEPAGDTDQTETPEQQEAGK